MILPYLPPLRFFASVDRPLERYFTEIVKAERPSREADLWMEAQERLAQLEVLVCRAKQLQDQHWAVGRAQSDAVHRARPERQGTSHCLARFASSGLYVDAPHVRAQTVDGSLLLLRTAIRQDLELSSAPQDLRRSRRAQRAEPSPRAPRSYAAGLGLRCPDRPGAEERGAQARRKGERAERPGVVRERSRTARPFGAPPRRAAAEQLSESGSLLDDITARGAEIRERLRHMLRRHDYPANTKSQVLASPSSIIIPAKPSGRGAISFGTERSLSRQILRSSLLSLADVLPREAQGRAQASRREATNPRAAEGAYP
jgi:hypothetical protein